jgi:hypothetical protein
MLPEPPSQAVGLACIPHTHTTLISSLPHETLQSHAQLHRQHSIMSTAANLALEGGDPRDVEHPAQSSHIPVETQMIHNSHNPNISFEEYMYYGVITRAEEKVANENHKAAIGPKTFKSVILGRFSKGQTEGNAPDSSVEQDSTGEKNALDEKAVVATPRGNLGGVSDKEWKNASRAVRTAGWSSAFYLITTDILGPFSTP